MSSTVFKRANHECATSMPRKITVVTESGKWLIYVSVYAAC